MRKYRLCIRRSMVLLAMLLVCLPLLTACSGSAPAEEDLPELVIGSDDYRPFNYIDTTGRFAGIDVELATEACRRMGYRAVFEQIDWDKKDTLLQAGKVDCLWGSFSMNGREDAYLWAGPYMYSRQLVAVQRDSDIWTLADLTEQDVAVQIGGKPEALLLGKEGDVPCRVDTVYCLLNIDEVIIALKKGYVDACVGHETALAELLDDSRGSYRFLDEPLLVSELGVAFDRDSDPALRDRLQAVLEEMRQDGTIRAILARYELDEENALEGTGW